MTKLKEKIEIPELSKATLDILLRKFLSSYIPTIQRMPAGYYLCYTENGGQLVLTEDEINLKSLKEQMK